MGFSPTRKRWIIGGAVFVALLVALALNFTLSTWGEVNRVTIDRPAASGVAAAPEDGAAEGEDPGGATDEGEPGEVPTTGGLDVFLLVGSDSREDLDSLDGFGDFGGTRADVVMLLLRTDTEAAVLSLPRDLYVNNICTGGQARINQMLEGCGSEMNGPTLLTIAVEELIGETVDHFAMVDLAGFQGAVDAVGGYEICVERPVRDSRADLELPAGCTQASGEQVLAWLRSRRTQELTDSGWRVIPGMSDLVRNERQRSFLIDMMGRLADFSSPQAIAATAQSVAPFVTVDSELTLVTAVNLAWTMRGLGTGAVAELDVPVYDYLTEEGAAVLLPSVPIDQIIAGFVAPEIADASSVQAVG